MKEAASEDTTKRDKHFDLTEEASKRKAGDDATIAGTQAEADDVNEETNNGAVNGPGDSSGENRVWTSLSED